MKAPGVRIYPDGSMRVTKSTRAEDMIWDAVQEALNEGMSPKSFRLEVISAWEEASKERLEDELRELEK